MITSGQMRSAKQWYEWVGLCQIISRYIFTFLIEVLNMYFVGVQMPKPDSWGTAFRCASRPLFRQSGLQKMRELYKFCLDCGLKSPKRAQKNCLRTTLADFFIKQSAPTNSKKGFYTIRLTKKEQNRGIFVRSTKEL